MKLSTLLVITLVLLLMVFSYLMGKASRRIEHFHDANICSKCSEQKPCGCRSKCGICNQSKPCGCNSKCGICNQSKPCGCNSKCDVCNKSKPCKCANKNSNWNASNYDNRECPPCKEPDPTKWVLKTSVPPCPAMPDMSRYMLKTECPPIPDMSKYTLKTSIPSCPPCIATCTKPCKIGECPPCPRARCPVVNCPEPKPCPSCPTAMCSPCPEPDIKCKASYESGPSVRPMLASTRTFGN